MKEIKAFKCEFCKKVLQRKHAMVNHEQFCDSNPKNKRICFDCVFCERKPVTYESTYQDEYRSSERTISGYFCAKKQKLIYPLNAERKLVKRYPNTFKDQIPMVAECDMFVVKPEINEEFFSKY